MSDILLHRAQILLQQQNYPEAEKILRDALASEPDSPVALSMLAEAYLQQEKSDEAEKLIDAALAISPDAPELFYTKARIAIQKDRYDDAEQFIGQSIDLDPYDADYFALWAAIKLIRKKYEEALDLANQALEIDASNIQALNTRSTALLKLKRTEESYQTIEGSLREDPNNPYTHSNYGWNLLEKGETKKALVHFKEALKNDPNIAHAQAGMMEALKASNVFYRWFLQYSLWMQNLTAKYQWAVILGIYFGTRFLGKLAASNDGLSVFLTPIVYILIIFAISTWVMTPLSNLLFRLNPYAKHLLTRQQMLSSNFVGLSLVILVAALAGYFITEQEPYITVAVFGFVMMIPCSVMFEPAKYKNAMLIYAGLMALTGIVAIYQAFTTGEMLTGAGGAFIVGFVIFQWVANFIMIRENNY